MANIGSSGNINKSNLISQAYANLYNLINTRSNISDPLDANGTRKFLYSREPNTTSREFAGYPFIIVSRPKLETSNPSMNSTRSDISWDFDVEVRSSDKIREHEGNGAYYCENIMNNILETIHNVTNRNTLRCMGMAKAFPVVDDFDAIDIGTDVIFVARLRIPFSFRVIIG